MDPRTAMTKLCDFGSAKQLRAGETNVYYICSRFYRSPDVRVKACWTHCLEELETLLNDSKYTSRYDFG